MKVLRKIHAKAPTRIDLAGGTLDIWPIYLFLDKPTTINLGIDLFAETELEETDEPRVTLESADQKTSLSFGWEEIDQVLPPSTLELHWKYLKYFLRKKKKSGQFLPTTGMKISTRARSPAGAGLGGSSTLSVSIIGALKVWCDGNIDVLRDGEGLVEVTRDVETTVIKVPAGLQDYYGAMFGGLQSLRWGAGVHSRSWLDASLVKEIQGRLLLLYSGQSRNSGINNWALFKAFIDGTGPVRDQFTGINSSARRLEEALSKRDWKAVGSAIASEWETRRQLAPGITIPEIDQAFREANALGATAGKICGAGGGGCFFVYLPDDDPSLRAKISEKLGSLSGIRVLPFQGVEKGLQVTVNGELVGGELSG